MNPDEKKEQKMDAITEHARMLDSNSELDKANTRSNSPAEAAQKNKSNGNNHLLVVLIIVLLLVILAFGGLVFYQKRVSKESASQNSNTSKTSQTKSSTDLTNDDNKPVTANIDSEVNYLDSAMNSQTNEDYSDANLSNTSLGIN